MEQNIDVFERLSVPRAVIKLAVPAIISMMVIVIYNVADTFFVGQTGDEFQVAAVSLTTPVFMLLWLQELFSESAEHPSFLVRWEKAGMSMPKRYPQSAFIYPSSSDVCSWSCFGL